MKMKMSQNITVSPYETNPKHWNETKCVCETLTPPKHDPDI